MELINYHHSMPTCQQRLAHAKTLGFDPQWIVDGGAFSGDWTEMVASIFPEASFLVVEPNPFVVKELRQRLQLIPNVTHLFESALANTPGTMSLNIWGDPKLATSASLQAHVRGGPEKSEDVVVDTLDNLLEKSQSSFDLIKLDLQGAELQALSGAVQTLKSAEMFIVEFGCLEAYLDRTTPQQLMEVFYDNEYCLYDIVDCHYRPYDGALTGGDFFFVSNNSKLREHKGWD